MNKKQQFINFLEGLKGHGQDALIESVKNGFDIYMEGSELLKGMNTVKTVLDVHIPNLKLAVALSWNNNDIRVDIEDVSTIELEKPIRDAIGNAISSNEYVDKKPDMDGYSPNDIIKDQGSIFPKTIFFNNLANSEEIL